MNYARIILEMLDRIKRLEEEVELLKTEKNVVNVQVKNTAKDSCDEIGKVEGETFSAAKRDKTRYLFEGTVFLKNRLVLAVVKRYVEDNPWISKDQLKKVFSRTLQGSMGVVENVELAAQRRDFESRFFVREDEVIHLCDGDMYVCNQWGILNIPNFLKVAEQLGYKIEQI